MIKAVVFDMDNTLVDFMKVKQLSIEAAVDAMIDAGLKMPRDKMLGKIRQHYDVAGIEDQQVFDKVLTKEFGNIDYKILASGIVGYRKAKEGAMTLYPHVMYTLTALTKTGLKMAIVSDAPRLPVWMRIVALGLHHFFDCVVTFDDTGVKKPDLAPFKLALDNLDVVPREAIMVGDWVERDICGAKDMGMKTAFARYGDRFNTQESGADYELSDISELLDIVRCENENQIRINI